VLSRPQSNGCGSGSASSSHDGGSNPAGAGSALVRRGGDSLASGGASTKRRARVAHSLLCATHAPRTGRRHAQKVCAGGGGGGTRTRGLPWAAVGARCRSAELGVCAGGALCARRVTGS
jgi:hypothetical protein